jgi:trans-aconitate methyltransferase
VSDSWNKTYSTTTASERSWTEGIPHQSLRFIEASHPQLDDAIIDIGGGSSRLVDELKRRRFTDVSMLDVSSVAIEESRARLPGVPIEWILDDITAWTPTRTYRLWHDRAVFHFLIDPIQHATYLTTALDCIEPGGHLVMGTFSTNGPETCSGLTVQRWNDRDLANLFADGFELVQSTTQEHLTPWASVQPFTWVLLRRRKS